MLIQHPADIVPSEITPEPLWRRRREFMRAAGWAIGSGLAGALASHPAGAVDGPPAGAALEGVTRGRFSTTEASTPWKDATSYNNYYEFGTDKYSPASLASRLKVRPWSVVVDGEVARPRTFGIDELLAFPREERIYRMRCVEGWSMVIPWVGFEFAQLARRVEPTSKARFVEFITAAQADTMPGLQYGVLDWPYAEGLRIDEAMHPLTLMAIGMYGQVLPNQNGAPVRVVVPWKYGFKSAKSIVRIRFTATQPGTAWNKAAANEYGFYSNVNPEVDHPRWSQATERRIGEFRKRPTLPFNGYADQVASLYAGMDLRKNF
jgi:sulfoxide reductase catalytic subunit YedY